MSVRFRFQTFLYSILLLVPIELGAASAGTTGAPSLDLLSCELPGLDRPALCGTLAVAEDPAKPDGRTIPLRVAVLPARGASPLPDPVFYLAGGPGLGTTASAGMFGDGFSALQERRDVVLVDLRGTGRSNPLDCPWESPRQLVGAFLEGRLDGEFLARCRAALAADPALYTTPHAADDLDLVREALGYEQVNLMAASFGTRVALVYLRRHPERVRTVTLRAVSPPSKLLHVEGAGVRTALEAVFEHCAADPDCSSRYPAPERRLDEVLASLDDKPATARVVDPRHGAELELHVTRDLFATGLFHLLYDTRTADRIPALLEAAAAGDFDGFAQTVGAIMAGLSRVSAGAYLSVVCAEDVPFAAPPSLEPASGPSLLGTAVSANLAAACRDWPHGAVSPDYKEPVRSAVPVLLLSGDRDPTTPPALAAEAARYLTASRHVVVEGLSHLPTWTPCFARLVARFVDQGSAESLPASCAEERQDAGQIAAGPSEQTGGE